MWSVTTNRTPPVCNCSDIPDKIGRNHTKKVGKLRITTVAYLSTAVGIFNMSSHFRNLADHCIDCGSADQKIAEQLRTLKNGLPQFRN
jgi:hypothetical protein